MKHRSSPVLRAAVAASVALIVGACSSGGGGGPPPVAPVGPSGLSAQATAPDTVELRWADNAADEDGYRVERAVVGGAFGQIRQLAAGSTRLTDTGLNDDTTYRYRVRAFNGNGNSAYSNVVEVATPRAVNRPPTIAAPFGAFGTEPDLSLEVIAGGSGNIDIVADDPDGDPLSWVVTNPGGRNIAAAAGLVPPAKASGARLRVPYRQAPPGRYTTLEIVVTDDRGATDRRTLTVYRIARAEPAVVERARLRDRDGDGAIGAGDTLVVRFDRPMVINPGVVAGDFLLWPQPSTGPAPSFGAGATVVEGPGVDEISVVLGVAPRLVARQDHLPGGGANAATGVDVGDGQTGVRSINGQRTARPSASVDIHAGLGLVGTDTSTADSRVVVLADINLDGAVDAVAGTAADGVELSLDLGAPVPARAQIGTGEIVAIAVGDLDRNGRPDLLTANRSTGAIEIWWQGLAGFGPQPDVSLPTADVLALAHGDVTGDGWPDVLVGTGAGTANLLWASRGGGAFAASAVPFDDAASTGVGDATAALVIADLNADGRPEVIAGNGPGRPSRVWVAAPGGYSPVALVDSGRLGSLDADTVSVAIGDVDGDGAPDVVEGNRGQANRIWAFDGAGVPSARGFVGEPAATVSMAVGDVDLDGDLDVVEGVEGGAGRLWLNLGGVMFDSDQALASGVAAAADFDRDGDLDVFVAQVGGNALYEGTVASVRGDFALVESPNNPGTGSDAIAIGDINADGLLDAVALRRPPVGLGTLTLWANDPTVPGSFPNGQDLSGPADMASVSLADLDPDGVLDAVTALAGAPTVDAGFAVWRGPLGPLSTPTEYRFANLSGATVALALADLDADGAVDVVLGTDQGLAVALNDAAAGQPASYSTAVQLSLDNILDVSTGDLDGDGDIDVVAGTGASFQVWINDGTGSGLLPRSYSGQLTAAVAVVDFDRDGRLDVVAAHPFTQSVEVWTSDVLGGLTPPSAPLLSAEPFDGLVVGDFDQDGRPDVAATVRLSGLTLIETSRAGQQRFTLSCLGFLDDPTAGDLDRDGDLDLLIAAAAGTACPNQVWSNR